MLAPLKRALVGAPGTSLADIGGGTGNYALALRAVGWRPTVIDRSEQMLARAAAKGLGTVVADAQALPFPAEHFDAAILVSMLHHVEDQPAALAEAKRVLRPNGRLAVMLFAWEDVEHLWCYEYFPSAWPWMCETHITLAQLFELLPGAERLPVLYEDMCDGSMAALLGCPELVLERDWRMKTSFFERLEREDPSGLEEGLARLAVDLEGGRAPRRPGGASVIAWRKPAERAGGATSGSGRRPCWPGPS